MKRLFILPVALAVAMNLALATPRSDLERARTLCEEGHYREGIGLFDTILTATAGTDAAVEADEALDLCVRKLRQSDGADTLLREISRKYEGRAAGAKALAALAQSHRPGEKKDCRTRSTEFNELLERYGGSRETAREIIVRSIQCLSKMEHEREALADLEKVADAQEGSPEGAGALYWLGQHYRGREDRDRAATYFQRIVDEYPETIEYPSHPGLKIGKYVRTDLKLLHTYSFSPLFDWLLMRIDKDLLQSLLGVDWSKSGFLSGPLLVYLVSLAALALAFLPIALLRHRVTAAPIDPGLLLARPWTPGGAAAFLAGYFTLTFLLGLSSLVLLDRLPAVWTILESCHAFEVVPWIAVLLMALRGETLVRVFHLDPKHLRRLILAIPIGLVSVFLLAAMILIPLWWLGLLPDRGVDRYLSEESFLRGEPWAWRIPLVILGATVEELLFRGVLHDALKRRMPGFVAGLLGSFVFAMAHVRPLASTMGAFATGVVLVALRERFRSLTPGSMFHSLWNFLMLAAH